MTIENPPSFPSHAGDPEMSDPRNQISCGGMTLRDYFAGQALTGMASRVLDDGDMLMGWGDMAKGAYKAADAMLAARKENSDG